MSDELKQIYFDALNRRIRTVKFLGEVESRKLEDVFVELTIIEEYKRPSQDAEILGFVDWERRRRFRLFDDDDREYSNRQQSNQKLSVTPTELLLPFRKVVVTGSPGCGKTTLLKYLIGSILEEKKRFPVFLELKTLTHEDLRENSNNLANLLFAAGVSKSIHLSNEEESRLKEVFFKELRANNVFIFLDGFDEIRDEDSSTMLSNSIEAFIHSNYGKNALIISTRPYALNRVKGNLEQMEISPLNQRQIEKFLKVYYSTDEACQKLLSELKYSTPLSEMVRVPILLSSIVGLYREKQQFAEDAGRTDIYDAIIKRLIAKIDQDKSVKRFAFKLEDSYGTLKLDFLKQLAFECLVTDTFSLHGEDEKDKALYIIFKDELILKKAKNFVKNEGLQHINPVDLADDIKATALLREIGEDSYAFVHLTLQEYLAAKVLAENTDRVRLFSLSYFNSSLVEMEVLPMFLALITNAEPLYETLEQLSESLTYTKFRLQLRGLVYNARISDERLSKIIDRVCDFIAGATLGESAYRLAIVRSLIGVKDPNVEPLINKISLLLDSESETIRWNVVEALGIIHNKKGVIHLIEALDDNDREVRWKAAESLGKIGDENAVNALVETLHDEYKYVREVAAEAIGEIGTTKAVDALIDALNYEDEFVVRPAIEALERIGNEKCTKALAEISNDEDSIAYMLLQNYFTRLDDKNSFIENQIEALSSDNSSTQENKVKIERVKNNESLEELIKTLNSKDSITRRDAAKKLGETKSEVATEALIKSLSDRRDYLPWTVAEALGNIGDEKAVESLIKMIADDDIDLGLRAGIALLNIKENDLSRGLEKSLISEDSFTRCKAVLSIGYYSLELRVLERLSIIAADDPIKEIRKVSAQAKEMFVRKLELFGSKIIRIPTEIVDTIQSQTDRSSADIRLETFLSSDKTSHHNMQNPEETIRKSIPSFDVLLLVVNDHEFNAVYEQAKDLLGKEPTMYMGARVYYDIGKIGGSKVALVRSEMGSSQPGAALPTALLSIYELQPKYIIAVEIMFGVDVEKQKIGQLLFSRQIQSYELQRISADASSKIIKLTRGDKVTANPQLLSRITAAAHSWSRSNNEIQPSPELILSGEKLVDNLDFRDELTTLFPEAKGGEMEASGIYSAARESETRWIIIKAICDYADGNKNKDKEVNQKLAASKAASFVFYLLKNKGLE